MQRDVTTDCAIDGAGMSNEVKERFATWTLHRTGNLPKINDFWDQTSIDTFLRTFDGYKLVKEDETLGELDALLNDLLDQVRSMRARQDAADFEIAALRLSGPAATEVHAVGAYDQIRDLRKQLATLDANQIFINDELAELRKRVAALEDFCSSQFCKEPPFSFIREP